MCLGHMIDELQAVDPDSLTDAEVTELVLALRQVAETVEATQLRAVGTFEARKLHKTDGAWSTGAWLRSHTDLGRREANSLERHARMVRTRPLLGMALDTLGATKLRTMLRYVTFRLGDAYAEAEAVLLEQVAKLDTDQTVVLMRGLGPAGRPGRARTQVLGRQRTRPAPHLPRRLPPRRWL